jgi:fermentation-respiration switch protein FrsA (DUF1100 family)
VPTYLPLLYDTVLTIGLHEVEIRIPAREPIADLVILPGWNYPRTKWCNESSLCDSALALGFRLILPEMGKSLYADSLYPETTPALAASPTRAWLRDTVIPFLQGTYGMLLPNGNGCLIGLSTGARGVAMLALDMPSVFKAGVALSGDYDLPSMPGERINVAMYGPFAQFPNRWRGRENPMDRIAELNTALYLGHGLLDNVVPPSQTQRFADAVRATKPTLPLVYNAASGLAHDFRYWESEVQPGLRFLLSQLSEAQNHR